MSKPVISSAADAELFQSHGKKIFSILTILLKGLLVQIQGDEADYSVSLFSRKEFIPNLEEKMPIRGYSCMIGRIEE